MASLDLTWPSDGMTWHECYFIYLERFDSTFTWPKVEKKHLMKLEWLISLNSVLLLEATPRSCLTSSSAVGQGHLYISTESDRSIINWEGSILRFPTICLTSIYLTIVSLPWDLQFLQRSPFMSFYLPISNPFEGHILEHYYFQQKKKQWHSRFRYDDVLQALDSSSVSPFFWTHLMFQAIVSRIQRFSWMIHQH